VRREHYFLIALILVVIVLFGFGSRAGLALQAALRGPMLGQVGTANVAASLSTARNGLTVPVYSRYPLNLKDQLSIAAGAADGIRAGDIALIDGYFVGIVEKTFENSAVVQTIFDKRFQAPVRIGAAGADALLKGGTDPEIALIPGSAMVSEGDQIYSAVEGVPYGTPLGSLRNLRDSDDKVFRAARLAVPYNSGSLKELTIIPATKQ